MSIKNEKAKEGAVEASAFLEKLAGPLTLAKAIRSTRLCAEMTQAQLAKKMKATVSYISNVENGRTSVSVKQAVDFAKVLEMSPEQFIRLALEDQVRRSGIKNFKIHFEIKKVG